MRMEIRTTARRARLRGHQRRRLARDRCRRLRHDGCGSAAPTSSSAIGERFRLELPSEDTTSHDARPLLLTLGLPTFGLAFAITILTTYGPSVLLSLDALAGEGRRADRRRGRLRARRPVALRRAVGSAARDQPARPAMPFVMVGAPTRRRRPRPAAVRSELPARRRHDPGRSSSATTCTTRRTARSTPTCCPGGCCRARSRARPSCAAPASASR